MTSGRIAIEIDDMQCRRVASIIGLVQIPGDREEQALLGFAPEEIANFYFLTVAICHQTQSLHGAVNGHAMRGWDYLSNKLRTAVVQDRSLLDPATWTSMTTTSLRAVFVDKEMGETLSDVPGRTDLVRDLGARMLQHGWYSVAQIYKSAESRVRVGSPNLLDLMGNFRAYRDPVFKKSFFFLGLMSNSGLSKYADSENLGAPVDYHEVRGHLRLGTVTINDAQLREKLFAGKPVLEREDVAIRSAVQEAISRISKIHGNTNAMELHYLFWNVFRSICKRVEPLCYLAKGSSLPLRYSPLVRLNGAKESCPFVSICPSADLENRYFEHQFETDWY